MTTVLALTQLVLITFGTIFLKGIVNANVDITSSVYFQFLDKNWPWFFLIPVAWIAYTQMSYQINKGPFTLTVARVTGIVLSGICLIYFASVIFFPSA
jgi:ABC-type enterochelin transport system permease subunit